MPHHDLVHSDITEAEQQRLRQTFGFETEPLLDAGAPVKTFEKEPVAYEDLSDNDKKTIQQKAALDELNKAAANVEGNPYAQGVLDEMIERALHRVLDGTVGSSVPSGMQALFAESRQVDGLDEEAMESLKSFDDCILRARIELLEAQGNLSYALARRLRKHDGIDFKGYAAKPYTDRMEAVQMALGMIDDRGERIYRREERLAVALQHKA